MQLRGCGTFLFGDVAADQADGDGSRFVADGVRGIGSEVARPSGAAEFVGNRQGRSPRRRSGSPHSLVQPAQ
jgi:hypothetical protein